MRFAAVVAFALIAAPAVAKDPKPAGLDRKVCRSEMRTGSIMPARRVCHTAAEWREVDADAQRSTEWIRDRRMQPQPGG